MSDLQSEKAPLLESGTADSPPTLTTLSERVTEAHTNLINARRQYHTEWLRSSRSNRARMYIGLGVGIFLTLIFSCLPWVIMALDDDVYTEYKRVSLEAHIMSKCPDARDCLREMVLPAMMNVSGIVDFKLSYIGTPTNQDDGVLCKHGPSECLGDILELCAADLYPNPKIYLGFTMCMSKDYQDIPSQDLVEECALEHGISFDRLNECASREDGSYGVDLLRSSVNRTSEAGVNKSCTIRLDGKTRCIRDGGMWTDCEAGSDPKDLVSEIRQLWNKGVKEE